MKHLCLFCFVLPSSKFFLGLYNYLDTYAILVNAPRVNMPSLLHATHETYVAFPLRKHLRPIYLRKEASHQTRLDTRSKARRPIKVGIKGRGRSGTSRDLNPACLCCSSAHLVQCEPDEASSFTNPNVGPGTYASLRLKLDAWSSAVYGWQRGQKCSSPIRRLPSRSWGPIRPRVCSWFRAPIRHECQTAQPNGKK